MLCNNVLLLKQGQLHDFYLYKQWQPCQYIYIYIYNITFSLAFNTLSFKLNSFCMRNINTFFLSIRFCSRTAKKTMFLEVKRTQRIAYTGWHFIMGGPVFTVNFHVFVVYPTLSAFLVKTLTNMNHNLLSTLFGSSVNRINSLLADDECFFITGQFIATK